MRGCVLVIFVAAACEGGSSGGPVPPERLANAIANSTCAKLSACCTASEFMMATLGSKDEASCQLVFAGLVGNLFVKVLDDSIAAGRVIYHADLMGECIATIDAATCVEYQTFESGAFPGANCSDPFEGLVAIGGDCANDFDCTSEYCSGDSIDQNGAITFGKCAGAPTAGQPCDNFDCAPGAFCDNTSTCAAKKTDGAPCTSKDECTSGGCNGTPGTCGVSMTCDGN